ncbi:MAG: hypothetical protein JO237_08465, partial [Pseudolabrys sp.]|nr:hypothetical protein [Pseudolabrys sp.]
MDLLAGRPPPAFDGARRSIQTEVLDDGGIAPADLTAILRDLARFNGIMSGHRPILR